MLGDHLLSRLSQGPEFGEKLPPLSADAKELLGLTAEDQSNPKLLAAIAHRDPIYLGRLMTYANSAYFGGLAPATSLDGAIRRIGATTAYSLLVTCALAGSLADLAPVKKYSGFMLKYTLSQVVTAKKLAHWLDLPPQDTADLWLAAVLAPLGIFAGVIHGSPLKEGLEQGLDVALTHRNYQLSEIPQLKGYPRVSALVAKTWGSSEHIVKGLHAAVPETAGENQLAKTVLAVESLVDLCSKHQDSSEVLRELLETGWFGSRRLAPTASASIGASLL